MTDCFRWVLRSETHDDHLRVDQLFSAMDITERDGLARFLDIHLTCFGAMKHSLRPDDTLCLLLGTLMDRLMADLAALGVHPTMQQPPAIKNIDPLAMEYMLAGSRLGARIIRARWEQAQDRRLQKAGTYLSVPGDPAHWQDICHRLSLIPADTLRATKILHDTQRLFRLFYEVGSNTMTNHAAPEFAAQ